MSAKKRTAGTLAVLGALALGVGATYAGFTDTEEGPNTLIENGTLDLRLSTEASASVQPIIFNDLRPGETRSYFVQLTNDGSISGKAFWAFEDIRHLENTCVPPEIAAEDPSCGSTDLEGELGDQLGITFSLMRGTPTRVCGGVSKRLTPRPFSPVGDRGFFSLDGLTLAPGVTRCVRVDVAFDDLPENNLAQSDSSSFGFRFRLVQ